MSARAGAEPDAALLSYDQFKMVIEVLDAVWCLIRFFEHNVRHVAEMEVMNKFFAIRFVAYLSLLMESQFHGFKNYVLRKLRFWSIPPKTVLTAREAPQPVLYIMIDIIAGATCSCCILYLVALRTFGCHK